MAGGERFRSLVLVLATLLLVASCARRAELPPYATEAGLLARDTCFGVEHLPPDFEVVARQILDNQTAARRDAPAIRPDDVAAWHRLSGAWLQYAFQPPSMPTEDADGFLTQDELEQALARAHVERLGASFTAVVCRLDLFANAAGAQAAFRAISQATAGQPVEHRTRGNESALVLAPAAVPGFARITLRFRLENVVATVSVTSACDADDAASCDDAHARTEALAALLLRRIADRVPGVAPPPPPADQRTAVEAVCPERDYTGCVAEGLAALAAATPVTLCVSPYGEWRFVHRSAATATETCPEDWDSVAAFPPASG
ncbi:MAG: hypothetical protein RMK01_03685 [Thermomicrobium sp.]|nr:hypothetical protein [Thermomicrobium sp.]